MAKSKSQPQPLPIIDTIAGAFKDVHAYWRQLLLPTGLLVFSHLVLRSIRYELVTSAVLQAGVWVAYILVFALATIILCRRLASVWKKQYPALQPGPLNWPKAIMLMSVIILVFWAGYALVVGVGLLALLGYADMLGGPTLDFVMLLGGFLVLGWLAVMLAYAVFTTPMMVQISRGHFQGLQHFWEVAKGHRLRCVVIVATLCVFGLVVLMAASFILGLLLIFVETPVFVFMTLVEILSLTIGTYITLVLLNAGFRIAAHMETNDLSKVSHPVRSKIIAVWHVVILGLALYGGIGLLQGTITLPDFSVGYDPNVAVEVDELPIEKNYPWLQEGGQEDEQGWQEVPESSTP